MSTFKTVIEFLKWYLLFNLAWLAAFATITFFCCLPRSWRKLAGNVNFEFDLLVGPELLLKNSEKKRSR